MKEKKLIEKDIKKEIEQDANENKKVAVIKLNNASCKEICPICGKMFTPDIGPWPFFENDWAPICLEDLQKHCNELGELMALKYGFLKR